MKIKIICTEDNIRLSEELKKHLTKKLYKNIKSSNTVIYVNDKIAKSYEIINAGDRIELEYIKEKEIKWEIYESSIDIYYEDDNYLIVNKPHGLLSIPTKAEPYSLYQAILYYLKEKNEPLTVSILNRLDKDTSGLCVIAKNRLAANVLQPTHEHMIRKYKCVVHGIFNQKEGIISAGIAKSTDSNKRYIDESGKSAISYYQVLSEYQTSSLLELRLETGRTHQIRLHTSYIGHPILGDKMYGIADDAKRLMLDSYYVEFYNSYLNKTIKIEKKLSFTEVNYEK